MMMMSMDTDVLMGSSPTRYTMEEPQVLWQSSQVVNIRAMVQKAEQRTSSTSQTRIKKSEHPRTGSSTASTSTDTRKDRSAFSRTLSGRSATSTSTSSRSQTPLTQLGNTPDSPICIGTQDSMVTTTTVIEEEDEGDGDVYMSSQSTSTLRQQMADTVLSPPPPPPPVLSRPSRGTVLTMRSNTVATMEPLPESRTSATVSTNFDGSTTRMGPTSAPASIKGSSTSSRAQSTRRATSWSVNATAPSSSSTIASASSSTDAQALPGMDLQRMIRQFGSVVKERAAKSAAEGTSTHVGRARSGSSVLSSRDGRDESRRRKRTRDSELREGGGEGEARSRIKLEGTAVVVGSHREGGGVDRLADRINRVEGSVCPPSSKPLDGLNKPRKSMERTGSGATVFGRRDTADLHHSSEGEHNTSMESLDLHLHSKPASPDRTRRKAEPILPIARTNRTTNNRVPLPIVKEEASSSILLPPNPPHSSSSSAVTTSSSHSQQSSQNTPSVPSSTQTRRLGLTGGALAGAPTQSSSQALIPRPHMAMGGTAQRHHVPTTGAPPSKPKSLGMRIGSGRLPSSGTGGATGAKPGGFKVPYRAPTAVVPSAAASSGVAPQVARAPMAAAVVKKEVMTTTVKPESKSDEDASMADGGGDSSFSFECDADELDKIMSAYD